MNFTRTAACYVFIRTERKYYAVCDHKNNLTETRQVDAGICQTTVMNSPCS